MANIKFETETKTFLDIMDSSRIYKVPKFQRDYAWKEEQWEDLWQDLEALEENEDYHYMGYLVLQQLSDKRNLTIIDGQQRLTTISILIIAVLYKLQEMIDNNEDIENNKKRLKNIKNKFIGSTDIVSLKVQPKLTLNRNNDRYFRNYICTIGTPPTRNTKASERLLFKACKFFQDKIHKKGLETGEDLALFINELTDKFLFTTITIENDLNAYKVFETLNARGVQLSVPDLLKNYIFSTIDNEQLLHDQQINDLEESWESITSQLGHHDFTRFIYTEWNSRNPSTIKSQLFKKIKSNINNSTKAFAYIKALEKSSEVYAALQDEKDQFWNDDNYPERKNVPIHLKTLTMFSIKQPHGLLLAAYHHFDIDKFIKVMRYIEVISIRYNIIGSRQANEQEGIYNKISQNISDGVINNLQDIKTELRPVYPSDDEFKSDFQHKNTKTTKTPKKARFLLTKLEKHINDNLPITDSELTLEHVLPKTPNGEWTSYFKGNLEESIGMLGNMTLLQEIINRDLGNKSFIEKKEVYAKSSLKITQQCAEYDRWSQESIDNRQKWLAEQAVSCWKIEI